MIDVTKFTKKKNKDKERSWCVGNLVRDRFYSAVNLVRNRFFPGTVGGVEADPTTRCWCTGTGGWADAGPRSSSLEDSVNAVGADNVGRGWGQEQRHDSTGGVGGHRRGEAEDSLAVVEVAVAAAGGVSQRVGQDSTRSDRTCARRWTSSISCRRRWEAVRNPRRILD
jgi:hypothetical protein